MNIIYTIAPWTSDLKKSITKLANKPLLLLLITFASAIIVYILYDIASILYDIKVNTGQSDETELVDSEDSVTNSGLDADPPIDNIKSDPITSESEYCYDNNWYDYIEGIFKSIPFWADQNCEDTHNVIDNDYDQLNILRLFKIYNLLVFCGSIN